MVFAFVDLFAELGIRVGNIQDWSSLPGIFSQPDNYSMLLRFAGLIFVALAVLFAFLVITTFFLRRSLSLMATKTGVGLFGTTGTLLLISAVLTIILIGFLGVVIAFLLLAIAFFSIRAQQTPPPPASASPSVSQAPV